MKYCKYCGAELLPVGGKYRYDRIIFCNRSCHNNYKKSKKRNTVHKCKFCGGPIPHITRHKNKEHMFCSRACHLRWYGMNRILNNNGNYEDSTIIVADYEILNTVNKELFFLGKNIPAACSNTYQVYNGGEKNIIAKVKDTTLCSPKLDVPVKYIINKIDSIMTVKPVFIIVEKEVGYSLRLNYEDGLLDFKNAVICVSPTEDQNKYIIWFNHKGGTL